ncbi:MAG TPA: HAD family hydrolase [Vicinamibacterales bacterium]|nr:HAD family hydrolase [Vicinamibacterales bacterium]
MLPERRAVAFDLDDTLYPHRQFLDSGFAAVAEHLSRETGLDAGTLRRSLVRARRGPTRGEEIQACLTQFDLPAGWLPDLVKLLRDHAPSLRLTRQVRDALDALRRSGWRLGILTNGSRVPQQRKLAALGLDEDIDAVVFAPEHGTGIGKPESAPFHALAAMLGVAAQHTVFVGNDEACDVVGALGAGMTAIRCDAFARSAAPTAAHRTLRRFAALPQLARVCLEEASTRHAA